MKTPILGLAFTYFATQAPARQKLSTTSPILEDAETLFCYYRGIAYSLEAFVVIFGENPVTSTTSTHEEHLLRCVKSDDGTMSWKPQCGFQISR
ncbi:hypothetical protein [Ruegeria meonggei]|uniref:hypothetical protein n=1 Tax=Ruegeria meonggei TaxID=1446476 RepID=UPI003670254A